ncbi:hypothetical protein ACROYT_G014433 [Oculina patagonica]
MALEYRMPGVFTGQMGNMMLLGLANVLKMSFVVFTLMEIFAVIPVSPRSRPITAAPIYLAFNHAGPGHYDAVILPNSTMTAAHPDLEQVHEEPSKLLMSTFKQTITLSETDPDLCSNLQTGGIADASWDSNGRVAAENLISGVADNQCAEINQDLLEAQDLGGPRKEFFKLIMQAVKEKYFDKGLLSHYENDYQTVGSIFGIF